MKRALIFLTVVSLGVMGWSLFARRPASSLPPAPPVRRAPYDPDLLLKTIAFYQQRVANDPQDFLDMAKLAGFYNQRCRETGDIADALRAEQLAGRSLRLPGRHAAAYQELARSLFTQHRFAESLSVARSAFSIDPYDLQALYLEAENRIEIGDYFEAERLLRKGNPTDDGRRMTEKYPQNPSSVVRHPSLTPFPNQEDLTGLVLRARLLEIKGQPAEALALLRQALVVVDRRMDLPVENVAWFHMRCGELLAMMGRGGEAEAAYHDALALFPRDHRTLTALTRLAASREDWQAVLDWGRKAADIVPTPEVVALIGDAYGALGRKKEAESQYSLIEAMGTLSRSQGVVYDRQRALYCADHDRHPEEALALARRELQARHDVYAYDTLAWVCCKQGRLPEAEEAIRKALAQGTQDARLYYHAGRIAYDRGNRAQATILLTRALAISPYFLPPDAPRQARELLAQLP